MVTATWMAPRRHPRRYAKHRVSVAQGQALADDPTCFQISLTSGMCQGMVASSPTILEKETGHEQAKSPK